MRAEIILVRHAPSCVPRPGGPDEFHRPLTEAGMAEAARLAPALAALRPDLIVSSPYLRAVQTVSPLARAVDLPVHTEHDLREWDSGARGVDWPVSREMPMPAVYTLRFTEDGVEASGPGLT